MARLPRSARLEPVVAAILWHMTHIRGQSDYYLCIAGLSLTRTWCLGSFISAIRWQGELQRQRLRFQVEG